MATILDMSDVPANLVITNDTDHAVGLPLYPDNSTFDLQIGDGLVIKVESSREYIYWYTTCRGLGLSLAISDGSEAEGGFKITAKIATIPSQEVNQNACTVNTSGNTITVSAKLAEMQEFQSTSGQGLAKWVGILISTGLDSIEGVLYNGTALTSADVSEASSVGGAAGDIILWIKAEEVVNSPKNIILTDPSTNAVVSITVKVVNVA